MTVKYDHTRIEKKWQEAWEKEKLYVADIDSGKETFYNLWMFPYPSAEGLHAGHAFASTGSDIFGRYQRMKGKAVFQPIGYDSFGIHSENYAIKINENPQDVVQRTTKHYEEQMRSLGHGYDWTRTVTTSDPVYYKWTQWLFAEMFKAGLAYKKKASVNFCPSCKTVLADEQVMSPKAAGKEPKNAQGEVVPETADMKVCERCGTIAEKRELDQWFMRITDYADRLLEGLDKIDWSDRVVKAQREWIGKSKGLSIDFNLEGSNQFITVWTKFWETVFGTTFLVVAPEYAKANLLSVIPEDYKDKVNSYIEASLKESDEERTNAKNKTGVATGLFVINPVNGVKVPVWVADYVLTNVGTGAVMGVPAHDERDFAFAKKYKLPIRQVVDVQVETHSLVIKRSVDDGFLEKIKKEGWYFTEYEDWGWGIVFPKGGEDKYIKIVQSSLKEGPWYVHTDGVLKEVIFKDKHFSINGENEAAKKYAREIGIPEEQIDWDDIDNYMFAHEKGGLLVNSGEFDGLDAWSEGKEKMAKWMIEKGFASWKTNYHLRDWLVSRQRYWGAPIPMIHCKNCEEKGVGYLSENKPSIHDDHSDWDYFGWWVEEDLPVILPPMKEYKPEGTGKGPLSHHPEFYEAKCPHCGEMASRETDVMDTFVDSSWYFLRYPSVRAESSDKLPFDPVISKSWLPVNLYFGGAEHSVLHLMYARFVNMVMHDRGFLDHDEPFPKFFAHGLMIKDGAKMSKSRGNVVNPDEYVAKFGADTLRMYLMFMGPMDGYPDFRDTGIEGMERFLGRLWKLLTGVDKDKKKNSDPNVLSKLHQTIKDVTEDIEEFKYNTAMAKMMELVNYYYDQKVDDRELLMPLTLMLAPFAPHMMEEIWVEYMDGQFSVHTSSWPSYEPKLLHKKELTIIIQVNGKVRGQMVMSADKSMIESEATKSAKAEPKVSSWIEGKEIKKTIFVPGKLINFVI